MTFFTVAEMCQELNIRHPEEMSLIKSPDDKEGYAKLTGWAKRKGAKVWYIGIYKHVESVTWDQLSSVSPRIKKKGD